MKGQYLPVVEPPATPAIHSDELERNLLGAILADPSCIDRLDGEVGPEDFWNADHADVFEALVDAYQAGRPLRDTSVVVEELKARHVSPEWANYGALLRLFELGPTSHHVEYYAELVRRKAKLRKLQVAGVNLLQNVQLDGAEPAKLAAQLEAELQAVGSTGTSKPVDISDACNELLRRLESTEFATNRVFSGLPQHDEQIGAWHGGELVILAARPSVGKTAMALQIATSNATHRQNPKHVLFVSLEMSQAELALRWLSAQSGVDSRHVRTGSIEPRHIEAMNQSLGDADFPLSIWAPPSATMASIRAVARQAAAAERLDFLVVDYIGLIRSPKGQRSEHERIAEISRELKSLAKQLNVPVLCLCQLNRAVEDKTQRNRRPQLSNLRDSGAIEQDADSVLFLHRADESDRNKILLIVAKSRHSATGDFWLRFYPDETTFIEQHPDTPVLANSTSTEWSY